MTKLLIAAFAATVGLSSVAVCSKEVQLNDQERAELRQRAEHIQQQGLTGGTVASADAQAVEHRPAATAKTKKVKHKAKAQPAKPNAANKTP